MVDSRYEPANVRLFQLACSSPFNICALLFFKGTAAAAWDVCDWLKEIQTSQYFFLFSKMIINAVRPVCSVVQTVCCCLCLELSVLCWQVEDSFSLWWTIKFYFALFYFILFIAMHKISVSKTQALTLTVWLSLHQLQTCRRTDKWTELKSFI